MKNVVVKNKKVIGFFLTVYAVGGHSHMVRIPRHISEKYNINKKTIFKMIDYIKDGKAKLVYEQV